MRSVVVRVWIGLVLVAGVVLAVGLERTASGGAVVWSLFGTDLPWFRTQVLPSVVSVLGGLAATLFFPVAQAPFVHNLIRAEWAHYTLARPVSRTSVVTSHVLGTGLAYLVLLGGFSIGIFSLFAAKGAWFTGLLWPGTVLAVLALSVHGLLVAATLILRSRAAGLIATLVYTLGLASWMDERLTSSSWWSQAINGLLDGVAFVFPPLVAHGRVMRQALRPDATNGPFSLESVLVLCSALASATLMTALAVWAYRRYEW